MMGRNPLRGKNNPESPRGDSTRSTGGCVLSSFDYRTATLEHTTIIGNTTHSGAGAKDGDGWGSGLDIAAGAVVTAKKTTIILGNFAWTAGDDVLNNGMFTTL